jgi:BMFP domain-containing protein YqiC
MLQKNRNPWQESSQMQGGNRILDDFARIMTDAAGMAQGVRREAEGVFKAQFERMIRDMDLVTREEFEAVREMAQLAREENDRLLARIEALEGSQSKPS